MSRCPNCKAVYQYPAQPSQDGVIRNGVNPDMGGIFLCACYRFFILVWPGEKPKWFIMR